MTDTRSARPDVAPPPEPAAPDGTDAGLRLTLLEHELEESRRENTKLRETLLAPPYSQLRALIRRYPQLSRTAVRALNVVTGTGTINLHRRVLGLRNLPRDLRDVRTSGLFDAQWYRTNYPEVGRSGMDPLRHFVQIGAAAGLDPGPRFSTSQYVRDNPDAPARNPNALLDYIRHGIAHGSAISPSTVETQGLTQPTIDARFPDLRPLRVYTSPAGPDRITLVTDSINSGSLFGGVGTALIFATLLARTTRRPLRIITRTEPPTPGNYGAVLEANGIECDGDVDFLFSPRDADGRLVDVTAGDLFITTSWWTTWATRASRKPEDIIYIVQEDERRFYPDGDESLRCGEIFEDRKLHFVVNSRVLFDHLWGSPAAAEAHGALWFEPAFPAFRVPREPSPTGKRKFIFYARPNNVRNLYYRGLEAISGAIECGHLDPDEWDFHFAGKDLQPVALPGGVKPALIENLGWSRYQEVLRHMDLGLSLMASPHPSYPPLDMAAAGAVVVTNTFGSHRRSLHSYSANIIACDPDLPSLIAGLGRGVALAKDLEQRRANHLSSTLLTDWREALMPVCERLAAALA